MLRDLSPRCAGPVIPYETPGRAVPGKYAGLGHLIRSAREAHGMTQAEVAVAVGASAGTAVSKWELGQSWPGRSAAALERVLGIRLPGPRCGRPENHGGQCRSAAAVVRYYKQDGSRLAEVRRVRGRQYGRPAVRRAAA